MIYATGAIRETYHRTFDRFSEILVYANNESHAQEIAQKYREGRLEASDITIDDIEYHCVQDGPDIIKYTVVGVLNNRVKTCGWDWHYTIDDAKNYIDERRENYPENMLWHIIKMTPDDVNAYMDCNDMFQYFANKLGI